MDTPKNVIADYLPPGPDEWIKDRFEHAAGIIEALNAAGYVIVNKQDYDDAIWGRTRLPNGGYLTAKNWPT